MARKDPTPARKAPGAPPAAGRPSISLCMMVKNEEKRLPTALKSAAPWVDEIIVVDTGSTDRTVEIAQEFGAKVYHHPWEYNFALHRNQSLSYASGDWLLILDADEELVQETAPLMYKLLNAPARINGFLFELYNHVTAGGETFILHPRLFRNHVGFHYEGQVHNRPMVPGQVAASKVRLIHYGYNEDPATMAVKHQRRIEMIRKWIEKEPDNYLAHSYMAHTLVSQPESRPETVEEGLTALRLLKELLKRESGQEYRYPHVYYPLINGLCLLGRDEECLKHVEDCLAAAPYYPDPLFFSVGVHYKHSRWEQVCLQAARFKDLQDKCRQEPDRFIFFENMTMDQAHQVYFRWVVAACLIGRLEEASQALALLAETREGESACQRAVQAVLALGQPQPAQALADQAASLRPEWTWPAQMRSLLKQKTQESQGQDWAQQGLAALAAGDLGRAQEMLQEAVQVNPLDFQALTGLGQAWQQAGQPERAELCFMRSLNLHPGQAQLWRWLADQAFARGQHAPALAAYQRHAGLTPADQALAGRLAACQRRAAQAGPTVGQSPPSLLVFLVDGMTPEMVRMPAPHFLMGRAWGELTPAQAGPQPDAPAWATLLSGVGADVHGLTGESTWERPLGLLDMRVHSLWELLPPEMSLGLAAAPLGWPAPPLPGWALAGYPFGPFSAELARPAALGLSALAAGYRGDFALSELDEQSVSERLERDIRQEALLYQLERHKLSAALALPAVDVLVIGLRGLAHVQRAFELANYRTYAAYQQLYASLDTLLMALKPKHFAILSQRGYTQDSREPRAGGFYCLSWLSGHGAQAQPQDVAPEILKLLGGDPSRLASKRK